VRPRQISACCCGTLAVTTPPTPAWTQALRQRLVQEHEPERGLAGVHQPRETGQFTEPLHHAREGLERHAGIAAFEALGVSRKTLSALLNGRAGISPEMAVRLSIAFDTSAESWLNQQVQYDLWQAEKRRKSLKVSRLAA